MVIINNQYYNKFSSSQNTRLFQAVGKKVFTNKATFTRPSGVVEVEVELDCVEASLPSEFTPSNLRQKEIFIKGTEPTTVSTRFSKLADVSNLKATAKDDTVTLTWDKVNTPEINTEAYLKTQFSTLFGNENYLNSYIASRLNYNNSYIGSLGYNVYLKDENGNLKLLDYVSTNTYKTKLDTSGKYTFVIKTAYSIFKSNMSDGKTITIDVTFTSPIIPEPEKPDNDVEEVIPTQ